MRGGVSQYGGIQPFLGVGVFCDGAGFSVEKSIGNKLPVMGGVFWYNWKDIACLKIKLDKCAE